MNLHTPDGDGIQTIQKLIAFAPAVKALVLSACDTEETTKSRMKGLFQKLGVHDRAEAVGIALQRGLLRLE